MKKLPILLLFAVGSSLPNLCHAQYNDLLDFNGTNGANPKGALTLTGGVLYGLTSDGGASTDGNVFSIHPNGSHVNPCFSFSGANGLGPDGSVTYTVGAKIYGMTSGGGAHGYGEIFSVDTGGQHFIDRWDFTVAPSTNGSIPFGSLIVSGRKIYGMTSGGGVNNAGNVFCIDTNGLNYKDLYDFTPATGEQPQGSLILIHNLLYGMTYAGGANSDGVVFSVDTSGGNYKDRWDFGTSPNTNGVNPTGSLVLVGKLLFGMTQSGGINGDGNIFSIDTNALGTTYKDRWNFDGGGDTNGSNPTGDLTYSGKLFYGMTSSGGRNSKGNIFYIDTAGTRYHDMFDFNGTNGQGPTSNVTLSGNVIYGMTPYGGAHSNGVVFSDTLIKVTITDTNISCNGSNNGYATAYVANGFSPFTYSWTGGSTTNKASGLSVGTYTVTVTDNNGLVTTAAVSISQPAAVAVTIASNTNVSCFGGANGSATANAATGGTGAYTYSWTGGGGTNLTATGLSAGTYTITATDAHGCTGTATVSITQPAAALAVTIASTTNESCHGDATATATANTATGGTAAYTYMWSPGGATGQIASGLSAGSYTVTVTDSHGCTATAKATVTQPAAIGVTVDSYGDTAIIASNYDGAAAVHPFGGTGAYTYSWSTGSTTDSIFHQNGGSYTVTVTDGNGCTYSTRVVIDNTAGIATINGANAQISLYPNPNNGLFAIKSAGLNGTSIVEIYNVLGEKVYSQTSAFNSPLSINLTAEPAGVYLYRILTQTGNVAGTGKLIIQK